MTATRVVLVDDHAVLRSGLKLLVQGEPDIEVVGEAGDAVGALRQVETLKPDVVVLDLSMPGRSGLDILADLQRRSPRSRVLVLTMHDNPSYLRRALKAGASGYVLKKAADTEVLSAIRAVAQGDVYVHSSLTRFLLEDTAQEASDAGADDHAWKSLSEREREVLVLVARGHTNAEIAERFDLSVKTIETYRARGLEKLGLRSRAALVNYALARGLLDD